MRPFADLFCGMGGFSLGLRDAGWTPVVAVDSWDRASEAYQKNFPDTRVIHGDIADHEVVSQLDAYKGKLFAVVGGPPCQSFSKRNRKRLDGSPLPLAFAEIAIRLRPDVILMEEVPEIGLLKMDDGRSFLSVLLAKLRRHGYACSHSVLNSENYGVAQSRTRLFLVARSKNKFGGPFDFGEIPVQPPIPVSHVLRPPFKPLSDHEAELKRKTHARNAARGVRYPMGYKEMDLASPSKTLTTAYTTISKWFVIPMGDGTFARPGIHHGLAIQGFPEDTKLTGGFTVDSKLIGNSVPPKLATKIALAIVPQ